VLTEEERCDPVADEFVIDSSVEEQMQKASSLALS
jgi:hypothetical protein